MRQRVDDFIATVAEFISAGSAASTRQAPDDSAFNELALSLFAYQFDCVKPYRQLCEHRGISPAKVGDWSRIPAVPASAFKEFELSSIPPEQRWRAFHSSGTTQHRPGQHHHDAQSLSLYEESLWHSFCHHLMPGVTPEFWCVALTPPPGRVPHSSLAYMFHAISRRFAWKRFEFCGEVDDTGAWQLDSSRCLDALQESVELGRPLMLLGTAFNFVHLIDLLTASRIRYRLPAGSRIMETGGYKGRSREIPKMELHRQLSERLGVPLSHIVCEYGMSESSSQAYDHIAGKAPAAPRIFIFPLWARARIVSPESGSEAADGEFGLIQIFDLANVRSVMAIQTEDLGIRREHGFELVGRAKVSEPRGCSLMSS